MIRVGLTGGIGSGKTIIGKMFGLLHIPVFSADNEAKMLLGTNSSVRSRLISIFGPDIYLPNQTIDRKKFASIIFNDQYLLKQVNEIVHPEVHRSFYKWSEKQKAPFVLYEAAILFESGHYRDMDYTILVVADEDTRLGRVVQRDSDTEEQIRQRMANQWTDEQKVKLANFIIQNNGRELIIPQVLEIIKTIKTDG
ncbi:MAG TPA: dephospho-CoA kinase [Prolixibacteraceae bacterium]|nr:dephospho-CoA kinase [Prolixibacteraceae bacterium]HCR90473.1 dephospho-CoA kinase [Prolixibacteraceae bacterium]HCU63291.1 dephospho-CoA kinase [Prolixibacteraceae bacterium]